MHTASEQVAAGRAPDEPDELILRRDIGKRLGNVCSETVRIWMKNGKLPKPDVDISKRTRAWRKSTLLEHGIKLV